MSRNSGEGPNDEEEPEELQELIMSDEEYEGNPRDKNGTPEKLTYTHEALIELRGVPLSNRQLAVLKPEFFEEDGYWNPKLWHNNLTSAEPKGHTFKGDYSVNKNLRRITRNLSTPSESGIPLLSPHRQSFGPGCHVNEKFSMTSRSSSYVYSSNGRINGDGVDKTKRIVLPKERDRRIRSSSFNSNGSSALSRKLPRRGKYTHQNSMSESTFACRDRKISASDMNNNECSFRFDNYPPVEKNHLAVSEAESESIEMSTFVEVIKSTHVSNVASPEAEWLDASDCADFEFDFGNLESLKKEYNDSLNSQNDANTQKLAQGECGNQRLSKVGEGNKRSRFIDLFEKRRMEDACLEGGKIRQPVGPIPNSNIAVLRVGDLEAPFLDENSTTEAGTKAFDELVSRFNYSQSSRDVRDMRPLAPNNVDITENAKMPVFVNDVKTFNTKPGLAPPLRQSRLAHLFDRTQGTSVQNIQNTGSVNLDFLKKSPVHNSSPNNGPANEALPQVRTKADPLCHLNSSLTMSFDDNRRDTLIENRDIPNLFGNAKRLNNSEQQRIGSQPLNYRLNPVRTPVNEVLTQLSQFTQQQQTFMQNAAQLAAQRQLMVGLLKHKQYLASPQNCKKMQFPPDHIPHSANMNLPLLNTGRSAMKNFDAPSHLNSPQVENNSFAPGNAPLNPSLLLRAQAFQEAAKQRGATLQQQRLFQGMPIPGHAGMAGMTPHSVSSSLANLSLTQQNDHGRFNQISMHQLLLKQKLLAVAAVKHQMSGDT